MEKIKFATQLFILLITFPVLFLAGISHVEAKINDAGTNAIHDIPEAIKTVRKNKCICKNECYHHKAKTMLLLLKS